MPTRAGWLTLLAGVASVVTGRLLGLPELYVLGAVAGALVVIGVITVRRSLPDLTIERAVVPRRVHRGGESHVELHVGNRSERRSPMLHLHDPVEGTVGARVAVAPVEPGAHHAATYRLPTDRRGLLAIGPLRARRTDPFGVASRTTEVAGPAHLTVLPSVEPLHRLPEAAGVDDPLAGTSRPIAGSSGGGEFAALREYVAGDDLRRVHWPSSARTGDLLVRKEDPPWQGHLTLLLDARAGHVSAERFEYAVTGAASIVHAVSRLGDRIRLLITDGTDSGLVDARAARETLLEHLALIEVHDDTTSLPVPPLDGRRHTGTLVVLTGHLGAPDLDLVRSLRPRFATLLVVAVGPDALAGDADVAVAHFPGDEPFSVAWHRFASERSR